MRSGEKPKQLNKVMGGEAECGEVPLQAVIACSPASQSSALIIVHRVECRK